MIKQSKNIYTHIICYRCKAHRSTDHSQACPGCKHSFRGACLRRNGSINLTNAASGVIDLSKPASKYAGW